MQFYAKKEFEDLPVCFDKQYLIKHDNFFYIKRILINDVTEITYYQGKPIFETMDVNYYFDISNLKLVEPFKEKELTFFQQYIYAPIIKHNDLYVVSFREHPDMDITSSYRLKQLVLDKQGSFLPDIDAVEGLQDSCNNLFQYLVSMDLFEVFKAKPDLINNKNYVCLPDSLTN